MVNFVYKVLLIRFRQSFRMLQSIGWGYVILIIPLVGLIFGLRALEALVHADNYAGIFFLLLPIGYLHFSRSDHSFLQQIASFSQRWLLFSFEYVLLMAPFWITLLFWGKGQMVAGFMAGAIVLAGFDKKWAPALRWKALSFSWIPVRAFEWRSGLRQMGFLLAFVWLIGLLASHWMWAIPGTTIISALFCASMYEPLESKELLEGPFKPGKLLWQKIGLHSAIFHVIFSLPYLVFFVRHMTAWWILVLAIVAVQLFLSFAILVKYANWLPNREKQSGQTLLSVFALGLLVPFLAPASLGLWGYYYVKAKKRLNFFYHAEN